MRLVFLALAALGACGPTLHEDVFMAAPLEQVDVLWVIDSSPSMAEERAALADGFLAPYAALVDARVDFHVAVTTTACDDPGLLVQGTVLTNADPAEAFRGLVEAAGTSPAGRCGVGAAMTALQEPNLSGANAGFYRDDAALKIIVVSDEDDASADDIASFTAWLKTLKPDPESTAFSGLIGPPGGCVDASDGARYRGAIQALVGIEASVCQPGDLDDLLGDLPDAASVPSRFYLTYPPIDGVVAVWVNQGEHTYRGVEAAEFDADLCSGEGCFVYTYDLAQNRIEMTEFIPAPTAAIHVLYHIAPR